MDIVASLRAHCATDYMCQDCYGNTMDDAAAEIERLRASQERLKSAIEFAHTEGFQWPSDPMAEFADGPKD